MAGTTFLEELTPLYVYNFHICVGNNHGGIGSGSDGWGMLYYKVERFAISRALLGV